MSYITLSSNPHGLRLLASIMPRKLRELKTNKGKPLTFQQAFAQVVRVRRKALGLSQEDLADADFSQAYVSMIELGKREVAMSKFLLLAAKLDMSPVELMGAVVEGMKKGSRE